MKELYRKLFESYSCGTNKRGVPSLENAAIFVSMMGKQYFKETTRLMVVGRASNGWSYDHFNFENAEKFGKSAESLFYDDSRFEWVNQLESKQYSLSRSRFWRVIKEIVKETNKDESEWYEKIVWSNLYKVSKQERPENNKASNLNPNVSMCRLQFEQCKKILCSEIDHYSPTHILFITDYNNWIADESHKGEMSFEKDLLSVRKTTDKCVEAVGKVIGNEKTKVIITNRPEGKNEKDYVSEVIKYF